MDAHFWDDEYKANPEHTIVPDRILMDVVSNLVPGSALDLGCGTGNNALMLAERGWRVHGVDWSEQAIRLATEEADRRGLDVSFEVADFEQWHPTQTFDLVFNTYSLSTGDAGREIIEMAAQALNPGGMLVIAEWDRSMAEIWDFAEDELWSKDALATALSTIATPMRIESCEVQHVVDMFVDRTDPRAQAGTSTNVVVTRSIRQ